MPKLRSRSGLEIIAKLKHVGFEVARVRGGHHVLKPDKCIVVVPIYGKPPLAIGTINQIYNDALLCLPEAQLRPLFYAP